MQTDKEENSAAAIKMKMMPTKNVSGLNIPTFGKVQPSKKGPSRIQRIGMNLKLSGKNLLNDPVPSSQESGSSGRAGPYAPRCRLESVRVKVSNQVYSNI